MKFSKLRTQEGRRERAAAEHAAARSAKLLPCGSASDIFRELGVGEERMTSFLPSSYSGHRPGMRPRKSRLRAQWWAPEELVELNKILEHMGVSSKQRHKALRAMVDGKEWPEKVQEAMAVYTERLIARQGAA